MSRKASPGKSCREGMSLIELFRKFPNNEVAEEWFIKARWNDQAVCPKCGSHNIQDRTKHPHMRFRCRSCRKFFSTKTGTVMESSKLGYQAWAVAICQMTTNLKGVSSMRLSRDLDIQQKHAWHLAHKIRETFADSDSVFSGKTEVDETYVGGLEKNKRQDKKLSAGCGGAGKAVAAGMKERAANQVTAKAIDNTRRPALHGFIQENAERGSEVFADDLKSCEGLADFKHKSVKRSVGEYVAGQAHISCIKSFWAVLKRAHKGAFHQVSRKRLNRYVQEFAGRHNDRPLGTVNQMQGIVKGSVRKKLTCKQLTA